MLIWVILAAMCFINEAPVLGWLFIVFWVLSLERSEDES
jgi:hypothetical protein